MRAEPSFPTLAAASQRRHLTILFSDLSDSTGIAASMEPELYAELLQHLRDMLVQIVTRHGGEIARIDGDGAVCIFGYPTSHEDAGRRAVEAAIDLHAAAATLDDLFPTDQMTVQLHSGIHAGVVLLRQGDAMRGRFEMLGDATNVAARLCDHARDGEIIVSETSLGGDRHFFRSGSPRQLRIAGHQQSVTVVNIHGRAPLSTRFVARTRGGATPFAGRVVELARLRSWFGEGASGALAVVGPPGIGKSRLIAEASAEAVAAGISVHRGYCEAYLGARPLQAFTQLMRSITGDPNADLFAPATAGTGDAGEKSPLDRAIVLMCALVAQAVNAGPCIFVIDDWQWADEASRQMLDALMESTTGAKFLIATRSGGLRLRATEEIATIEMQSLSPRDAKAAIAGLLSTPDPFLPLRIFEQSGGNPLFLEELCHASLRSAGDIDSAEPNACLDMLIQARFADLPAEQAQLVRAASVIGHMVPTWLFAAVTGVEVDAPSVRKLADADFLFPGDVGGTIRFKHGITRDAVYRAISLKERQALHKRVVEALGVEADRRGEMPLLEALSYHCAASGEVERAVPYAVGAGDAALAAGALDRAQAHYRQAFDIVAAQGDQGPLAEWVWPLVNKYGLACIVDPAPDQLPVMHEMARRLQTLGNPQARIRSEYWLGAITYGLGESKSSVAHLTSAVKFAGELGQTGFIPQIETKLAQSLFAAGRYDEADALFTRLFDAIFRMEARIDDESFAYALCCHGFLYADRGDFISADRRYGEADVVRGSGTPPMLASYLTQKSAVCLFRGDWAEAHGHAQASLQVCGSSRARYQAMMSNALSAYAEWQRDHSPGALDTLAGTARWFASGRSQQRTSLVYGWLADITAEAGHAGLVRHYAARALARVRRSGDRLGEAVAYRALARLAARQGDAGRAQRCLTRAYRSAAIRRSLREEAQTRLCEGELALAAGDRARARVLLGTARAAFLDMDMPFFTQRADALLTSSR